MNEDDIAFIQSCITLIEMKGDPRNYTRWNEDRFRSVCPELWFAWRTYVAAQDSFFRTSERIADSLS